MLGRQILSTSSRRLVRLSSSTSSTSTIAPFHPPKTEVPSYPLESAVTDLPQAPNYPTPWSTNQRPRPNAHTGARFEQTAMQLQPQPPSAMEMISREPIRLSSTRVAICDGGGGPLGHPKIFINLDKPGAHACTYCGIRFEKAHHEH